MRNFVLDENATLPAWIAKVVRKLNFSYSYRFSGGEGLRFPC